MAQSSKTNLVTDISEITTLLRIYAFSIADYFGAERSMVHISGLLDSIPPLINLRAADGVSEDIACAQVRGIQEVLICARGSHKPEMKLHYIQRILDDPMWCWEGKRPEQAA